ncbi:TetR/AcrR family transcriptional regulator C-terminal domain-containing protein [Nocardia vinacea]|uniref:TetR/AcrR family transcriptional regulator C-terminal domain-containing protein n=1 Tax=Nocardia vinacea TaxID=96468 RepID=A0ABZ1Z712_9NOCA|nr:TetR/AcrR family transcriptional regulator C-terminal domain-containing protein [Nocardia vinacea]
MAKRATAEKRPRRERGSLNPEDILDGAFELAEEVSLDNLSMPMLGKHLDVGVTSIYWYFRKKDDLLNAMADRALRQYAVAAPFVEADDWRETLRNHARTMRETFLHNPILCDLILIRSALSPEAARHGALQTEQVIASLVEAGLSLDDAVDTYSVIQLHTRGSIVLQRLYDKNKESGDEPGAYYENLTISPETTPLLAEAGTRGHRSGAPDDHNFEYGLECILERASRLIGAESLATKKAAAPAKKAAAKTSAAKKTTTKKKTTTASRSRSATAAK